MTHSRARRGWLLGFGALAAPALVASIAYACVSLATLEMSSSSGDVGQTVSGNGFGFSTNELASPVEVHFGSRSGPVVWAGRPNASGQVAFAFVVPQTAAGHTAVIATQSNANGTAVGGTPARFAFEVLGAPVAPTPVAAVPAETTPVPAVSAPTAPAAARPGPARQPAVASAPVVAPAVIPAPVPAVAPAPVLVPEAIAAPVPVAPAPANVAPAPVADTPAASRRSVMVSMSGESDGSPWLAIGLVGLGLVLSLGATALVVSGRRTKAPVAARR